MRMTAEKVLAVLFRYEKAVLIHASVVVGVLGIRKVAEALEDLPLRSAAADLKFLEKQ